MTKTTKTTAAKKIRSAAPTEAQLATSEHIYHSEAPDVNCAECTRPFADAQPVAEAPAVTIQAEAEAVRKADRADAARRAWITIRAKKEAGAYGPVIRGRDVLRTIYTAVYTDFALSTADAAEAAGISRDRAYAALRKLEAAGIVTAQLVNADDQTRHNRNAANLAGLTWQTCRTYDDVDAAEAAAIFDAAFPAPAPKPVVTADERQAARSAGAKKAWETMRARKAAAEAAAAAAVEATPPAKPRATRKARKNAAEVAA